MFFAIRVCWWLVEFLLGKIEHPLHVLLHALHCSAHQFLTYLLLENLNAMVQPPVVSLLFSLFATNQRFHGKGGRLCAS